MTPQTIVRISLALGATALIVRRLRRVFQFIVVNGESMRPTLRHGDLLVGKRRIASVSRGDVVVFTVHPDDYGDRELAAPARRVKRIVAVAGDRAPAMLPERLRRQHGEVVPDGHVALAGDALVSEGSAQFGYIDVMRVESVVVRRLRRGRAEGGSGPASGPDASALTARSGLCCPVL